LGGIWRKKWGRFGDILGRIGKIWKRKKLEENEEEKNVL